MDHETVIAAVLQIALETEGDHEAFDAAMDRLEGLVAAEGEGDDSGEDEDADQ